MCAAATPNNNPPGGGNEDGGGGGAVNDGVALNINGQRTFNCIEREYNSRPSRSSWIRHYQSLREKCEMEASEKNYAIAESEKTENRILNRYRDVNPYDHSRIILHRGNVDYINANLVMLERAERKYVLTQGPLPDTVGHFWLMVWEQKSKAILMLNKLMEKKQVKCHRYWPERKGAENALHLNDVKLSIEFVRYEEYRNFIRRLFKLTDHESNESREIIQFHYTTWPDFGIPSSPVAFLQFLKQVRDSGALDPTVGPAIVHCSAGIGRSGTFCLVDCCLVLVDKEGVSNVSVDDVLLELRRYRMGLIQTADQLFFSYQAIIEGIRLLKDQAFIDYNEEPTVTNDDHEQSEQYNLDETPPPLPPRTHSLLPGVGIGAGNGAGATATATLALNLRGSLNAPLPLIPSSTSFNDDLYSTDNNQHQVSSNSPVAAHEQQQQQQQNYTDALNNFINNATGAMDSTISNRPLPPLPPQYNNSLDRVHESDSDENDLYEEDDNDDDDDDDEIDSDNADNTDIDSDDDDKNGNGNRKNLIEQPSTSKVYDGEVYDMKLSNGIESVVGNNISTHGDDTELKRRKHVDRQANLEQKVNEIKRKGREAEEGRQAAKKRRHMMKHNNNDKRKRKKKSKKPL